MPGAPILALTATATVLYRNEIKSNLNMRNVITVEASPNRENIYYSVLRRDNKGEDKLVNIIKPLEAELKEKLIATPLTIIYSNLETCGECYSLFEQELGLIPILSSWLSTTLFKPFVCTIPCTILRRVPDESC